jgi:hypothetical protein
MENVKDNKIGVSKITKKIKIKMKRYKKKFRILKLNMPITKKFQISGQ